MPDCAHPVDILIIEDDALLGRVLERVLTCGRQTALFVGDGGHALELVKRHSPRLVLLDASLRDGSARKLVQAIGTSVPAIPVIVLSTHRFDSFGLPGRIYQVVSKSIDLPELRRVVESALCQERSPPVGRPPDASESSAPSAGSHRPVRASPVSR